MPRETATVLVAGTGGGVGTTTIAALLFESLSTDRSPVLLDHTDGDLGRRLPSGSDVGVVDESLQLHDLGAHATGPLLERLAQPLTFAVVAAPTTPAGFGAIRRLLTDVRDRHGSAGLAHTVVAAVGAFGSHPTRKASESLQNDFGWGSLVVIPRDPALAAGGRVPLGRLSRDTRRAQRQLARLVGERLGSRAL